MFGTASSQWNHLTNNSDASNLSLTDDTGAATSVELTFTRSGDGRANSIVGTYANLGISSVAADGSVTLSGLLADGTYKLAIFSAFGGTFTVGTANESASGSFLDWNSLNQGTQYALFQSVTADGSGDLSFLGQNPTFGAGYWSAFQLQSEAPPPLPEPSSVSLLGIGLAALYANRRKAKPAA